MKVKFLTSLIFCLVFTFWPLTVAQADSNGLKVEAYTFDASILPDRQAYTLCESGWTSAPNIDADWGDGVVAECTGDFILLHYSGYITSPKTGLITFTDWSDDGFWMSLDDVPVIDAWTLKGCSPASGSAEMVAGVSQKIDVWFYEYGGGACNRLFWDAQDGVNVVPSSAFSQDVAVVEPPVIPEPPVIVPTPQPTIPVVIPEPPVVPTDPEPPVVPVDPEPPVVEPVTPEPPVIPDVPVVEPVTPVEPSPTPEPVITPEPPVIVPEPVLSPAEEHQALLDNLLEQAQADDIQVPENIAAIPVLGASIVALTNALNFMGNVGADMSPEVRAKAKKEVIAAVVLTQISQFATSQAVASAQVSASSGASGSSKTRRNKE
jgi:hypothetical protein